MPRLVNDCHVSGLKIWSRQVTILPVMTYNPAWEHEQIIYLLSFEIKTS